jgi:hypothetical protein
VTNVVWETPSTGWTFFHLLVRSHDTVGLFAAGKSQYAHTRPDLPRGTLPVLSGFGQYLAEKMLGRNRAPRFYGSAPFQARKMKSAK